MTVAAEPLVYDPFSWNIQHNPYPTYKRLRQEAPVFHNAERGFWALSRYDDVLAAHLDPATFVSSRGVTLEGNEVGNPLLILKDPPEHEWHRRVVSRVFNPRYVATLEPFIRNVAAELLDRGREAGGFDVVEDFSVQLPLRVASELLGIPEEYRQPIHHLSDRLVARTEEGTASDDALAAMVELGAMLYELVVERRKHPADDVVSLMVTSPVVDDRGVEHYLTDDELAYRFLELAFAGHETVARLIPNGVVALTWFPDQRELLVADPSLVKGAVEEMLRWDAPSHYQGRWSTRASEWHGVTIPEDARVVLVTGAANHDPSVYPDPERFDVRRTITRTVSFGFGVHLCLGANLARIEARIAFEEFLSRFPAWELDEAGVVRLRSGNVRGLAALPLRLP
ncbi:MAG TPA: cytochrome P450 [Acidimicrobiales bacterium]|nr:cytochrome P450 [Acidimicrobiales bacterium]